MEKTKVHIWLKGNEDAFYAELTENQLTALFQAWTESVSGFCTLETASYLTTIRVSDISAISIQNQKGEKDA